MIFEARGSQTSGTRAPLWYAEGCQKYFNTLTMTGSYEHVCQVSLRSFGEQFHEPFSWSRAAKYLFSISVVSYCIPACVCAVRGVGGLFEKRRIIHLTLKSLS